MEEWSREATFESCSKQFRSQNLYLKATRFRLTCDCVAQVSVGQNVRSLEIYTNQHVLNFSEECCLHLVAPQMSWQQTSSLTPFVHIYQEEPRQSVTPTNDSFVAVQLLSVTLIKIHQNILAMPIMPSSIQIIAQSPKSSLSSTADDKKHNTHLSYFLKFFSQSKFSQGGIEFCQGGRPSGPSSGYAFANEQLADAYSKELTLRTAVSSHKLSSYWGGPQKRNQPQAPRKPFCLPVLNHLLASVFKWCKQRLKDP